MYPIEEKEKKETKKQKGDKNRHIPESMKFTEMKKSP